MNDISRIYIKIYFGWILSILTMSGQIWGQYLVSMGFEQRGEFCPTGGIVPCTMYQDKNRIVQGSVLIVHVVVHVQGWLLCSGTTDHLGGNANNGGMSFDIAYYHRACTNPGTFANNHIA